MKTVPLRFKGTDCPACGAKESIRFIGRNSKAAVDMDDAWMGTYEAKCDNCDHQYILTWNSKKFMLTDMNRKFDKFMEKYTYPDLRDVDTTVSKQYELPSEEELGKSIFGEDYIPEEKDEESQTE